MRGANKRDMQLRAAAIVRRDKNVLLHRAEVDTFWALPGGRIEFGESAEAAVVREMHEELGLRIHAATLRIVSENFFVHQGESVHEVGFYFDCEAELSSLQSDGPHLGLEKNKVLIFNWFPIAELHKLDVRPRFIIKALETEANSVRHVVMRDPANA